MAAAPVQEEFTTDAAERRTPRDGGQNKAKASSRKTDCGEILIVA